MLDFAPDGILVVAASGEIVFANGPATEMFDVGEAGLVGRSVDDLLPEDLRGAHRAHRTRYAAAPAVRAMGAGLQLRARRADGTEFHAEISLSPFASADGQYVVAAVRDISERVASEDRLRRVLHSLDITDDAILVFDAETLRLLYVNAGTERMLGYSQDELLTMTPLHFNPDTTAEQYRSMVEQILANPDRTLRREATLLRRDGVEVPVEKTYRAGPVGSDGAQWVVALGRDISERLASDRALREHEAALAEAERIVALVDDRERIARDLHDTVIQRLFAAGLGLQSVQRIAGEPAATRIAHTIDELDVTIRELRSAIFSLGSTTPTMGGLRGRMLEVINEIGTSSGIETRVQFDGPIETLPDDIAVHLVPVVTEAVSNAAKHGGAHQVRVAVTVGDDVEIVVADDGVGVSGEVVGGHGIVNLRERAAGLGGSMSLSRCEHGGTELRWSVPAEVRAGGGAPTGT